MNAARIFTGTALILIAAVASAAADVKIPDTPAGRCASAWFSAYESGEPAMRAFEKKYRAALALKKRSIDDRMTQYAEMRDRFGDLEPSKIIQSGEHSLTLIAASEGMGESFRFEFQFEDSAPHGLLGIMIQGPISAEDDDEQPAPLDSKAIKEIVDGVAEAVDEHYVYPDKGRAMAEAIRKKLADGEYDKLTNATALAMRLTTDLRAVCDDKHLAVMDRADAPEAGGHFDPHRAARNNYSFEKVERLPGNIGYVKFNLFQPGEEAEKVAAAAMNFLGNSDALIFDLRDNGGGSPEMIAFISGYLFDKSVLLNKFYNRPEDKTTETWSRDDVPGHRFGAEVPVYVLTSGRTFSGAEEFTYNLKNLKRGTIIGATTGGGAHPVGGHTVAGRVTAMVPFARAINPITNTNWEGTGVTPDIDVPAADALEVAQREALKKLSASSKDPQQLAELKAAQRRLDRKPTGPRGS